MLNTEGPWYTRVHEGPCVLWTFAKWTNKNIINTEYKMQIHCLVFSIKLRSENGIIKYIKILDCRRQGTYSYKHPQKQQGRKIHFPASKALTGHKFSYNAIWWFCLSNSKLSFLNTFGILVQVYLKIRLRAFKIMPYFGTLEYYTNEWRFSWPNCNKLRKNYIFCSQLSRKSRTESI